MNRWSLMALMLGACSYVEPGDKLAGPDSGAIESRYCEQTYAITGTFQPGTPARDASTPTGCWPVGAWTFQATLDPTREVLDYNRDGRPDRCGDVPGTANPMVATSYGFRVDRMDDGAGWVDRFTYTGSHQAPTIEIDVSGDGGAECEGDLELVDGEKSWNFKVAQTGTQLSGYMEFREGTRPHSF